MIRVVWEFEEQEWADKLSRAALEAAVQGVCQHLADLCCPVHGESPTLVVGGRSEDTIRLDIQGCCDRLVEPARAKLAELEGGSEVGNG
ncbi:MAG: hypothetical protein ACJ8DC_19125 [Gemmatimonadales bacterium]